MAARKAGERAAARFAASSSCIASATPPAATGPAWARSRRGKSTARFRIYDIACAFAARSYGTCQSAHIARSAPRPQQHRARPAGGGATYTARGCSGRRRSSRRRGFQATFSRFAARRFLLLVRLRHRIAALYHRRRLRGTRSVGRWLRRTARSRARRRSRRALRSPRLSSETEPTIFRRRARSSAAGAAKPKHCRSVYVSESRRCARNERVRDHVTPRLQGSRLVVRVVVVERARRENSGPAGTRTVARGAHLVCDRVAPARPPERRPRGSACAARRNGRVLRGPDRGPRRGARRRPRRRIRHRHTRRLGDAHAPALGRLDVGATRELSLRGLSLRSSSGPPPRFAHRRRRRASSASSGGMVCAESAAKSTRPLSRGTFSLR